MIHIATAPAGLGLAPYGSLHERQDEMTGAEVARGIMLTREGRTPEQAAAEVTGCPLGWIEGWGEDDVHDAVAAWRSAVRRSASALPPSLLALAYRPDEHDPRILYCKVGNCGAHPLGQHEEECPVGEIMAALEMYHAAASGMVEGR